MRCLATALVGALLLTLPVGAQESTLTSAQIEDAVRTGSRTRAGRVGLFMKVSGFGLGDLTRRALRDDDRHGWEPVGLTLYTPATWIQVNAAMAAEEFLSFASSDVTADMTRPVLRVFFKPDGDSRVVLRSTNERDVLQPSESVACNKPMPFENESRPDCREFQFALDDVRRIGASGNGEFLVTVRLTGENWTSQGVQQQTTMQRDFRVRRGDLNKLPGLGGR